MNKKIMLIVPIVLIAAFVALTMTSLGIYYVAATFKEVTTPDANKVFFYKFFNNVIDKSNKWFKVQENLIDLIEKPVVINALNATFCFLLAILCTTNSLNSALRWFKGKTLFPYLYTLICLGLCAYSFFNGITFLFIASLAPFALLILSIPSYTFYIRKGAQAEKPVRAKKEKPKKEKKKKKSKEEDAIVEEIQQTIEEIETPHVIPQQQFASEEVYEDYIIHEQPAPMPTPEPVQEEVMRVTVDQQRLLEQQELANRNLEALKGCASGLADFLNNVQPTPVVETPQVVEPIVEDDLLDDDDFEDEAFVEEVAPAPMPMPTPEPVQEEVMRVTVDQQRLLEQQELANRNLEALKGRASGLTNFLNNAQPAPTPIVEEPQLSPTQRVQNIRDGIGEERLKRPYPDVVQIDQNRLLEQESDTQKLLEALKGRAVQLEGQLYENQLQYPAREPEPPLTPTQRVQNVRDIVGEDRIKRPRPDVVRLDQERINEQMLSSERNIESLQSRFADLQSNWANLPPVQPQPVFEQPIPQQIPPMVDVEPIVEDDLLEEDDFDQPIIPEPISVPVVEQPIIQPQPQPVFEQPIPVPMPMQDEIMRVNQQVLLQRQQAASQNIDALRSRFANVKSSWAQQPAPQPQPSFNPSVQSPDWSTLSNNSEIQRMFEVIKLRRPRRGN